MNVKPFFDIDIKLQIDPSTHEYKNKYTQHEQYDKLSSKPGCRVSIGNPQLTLV